MILNDIHPNAKIGPDVKIDNFTTICDDVVIGDIRLVDCFLKGHFKLYKPGHKANAAFAKYLMNYINSKS